MPTNATESTPATLSKAQFIRSQPLGMPVKDLLAKAKDAGIVMTDAWVYMVRAQMASAAKALESKAEAPQKPPSEANVSTTPPVRATSTTKATASATRPTPRPPVTRTAPKPGAVPESGPSPTGGPTDTSAREFTRLVVTLGLDRAEELLLELRTHMASFLGR